MSNTDEVQSCCYCIDDNNQHDNMAWVGCSFQIQLVLLMTTWKKEREKEKTKTKKKRKRIYIYICNVVICGCIPCAVSSASYYFWRGKKQMFIVFFWWWIGWWRKEFIHHVLSIFFSISFQFQFLCFKTKDLWLTSS